MNGLADGKRNTFWQKGLVLKLFQQNGHHWALPLMGDAILINPCARRHQENSQSKPESAAGRQRK